MPMPAGTPGTATAGAPMVFISYRREDSGGHVGRLYDALSAQLGRQRLFFDIDHIAPGQDFVQVLDESLTRCSVLLVVIGKRWAGSGKIGARRIDSPGDFVRMEVAAGLRRSGLRVIPVLIQGAKMPGAAALPEDLKDLARRNAIELSDLRWKEDVARLIASLDEEIKRPASPEATLPSSWKWAGAAAAALIVGWAAVARSGGPATASGPGAAVNTVAASALKEIPRGDPPKVPDRLDRAARAALPTARKWRADAVLTEIEAKLPDTTATSDAYQVDFRFRSPSDGAGLTVVTGLPGGNHFEKLPAAGKASTRALPDSFIDLPHAIATARAAGMFGQVRIARLAPAASGARAGRPTWTLRPFETGQAQAYYVDALTGKAVPAAARKRGGLIGKVEGIFD